MKLGIAMLFVATLMAMPSAATTNVFGSLCNSIFAGSGSTPIITPSSILNYSNVLSTSLLLATTVLSFIGVLYGVGYAFKLTKLSNFAKTEYIESVANIVLIIAMWGGMGLIAQVLTFSTNFGISVVAPVTQVNTPFIINTPVDLFSAICVNYGQGFTSQIVNFAQLKMLTIVYSALNKISFSISTPNTLPASVSFKYSPVAGIMGIMLIVVGQITKYMLPLMMAQGGIIFFLAMIYYLFPLLLYLGLFLRAFPWTRPAGGALVALFISFYIFFPAIVFPFSAFTSSSVIPTISGTVLTTMSLQSIVDLMNSLVSNILNGGGLFAFLLEQGTATMIYSVIQLVALIVGFLICLDVVQEFGKLLGAPSTKADTVFKRLLS